MDWERARVDRIDRRHSLSSAGRPRPAKAFLLFPPFKSQPSAPFRFAAVTQILPNLTVVFLWPDPQPDFLSLEEKVVAGETLYCCFLSTFLHSSISFV